MLRERDLFSEVVKTSEWNRGWAAMAKRMLIRHGVMEPDVVYEERVESYPTQHDVHLAMRKLE